MTLAAFALTACDDVFEPLPENNLELEFGMQNSNYAEGIIGNVYSFMPSFNEENLNEVATDDAVHNLATNEWRRIAAGEWTSQNDPSSRWNMARTCIQYCNLLLKIVDEVQWVKDPVANVCFRDRFYAEARALRGIMMFQLLQAHAGVDASGQLLGIPIVTVVEDGSSNFNVPRDTFKDCYDAMMEDFTEAMALLPDMFHTYDMETNPNALDELRKRYPDITESIANRVYGETYGGRMCGQIVKGFMSRAALMAASPAYEKSGVTWQEAADAAANVLKPVNGIAGLDPNGLTWYCDPDMKDLTAGTSPKEVIWRTSKGNSNSREKMYFPPSLYGSGRVNPSHNFVCAFPMANGYPIDDSRSGYDPQNPYAGRDPRLTEYVIYNGSKAGTANSVINTAADSPTNDGLDKISTSTRTGYYLKKHLRMDVNANPSNQSEQFHYTARLRYTEFFLNYAEAMNEAQGPQATGSYGYSAYDVVKAIRQRAGITDGDAYLESIKGDKDKMRQLIRNERRLELCFEGFRFYDLRRWKADLNEAVQGIHIEGGVYTPFTVETRNYKDYMYYGPIPYSETLKFSNLQQNQGW